MSTRYALGRNAALYFSTTDVRVDFEGAPAVTPGDITAARAKWTTWLDDSNTQVAGNVMDLTLALTDDVADITTRDVASFGFSSQISVLHGSEATFEIRWEPRNIDDAQLVSGPWDFTQLLLRAWENNDVISLAALDQNRVANPSGGGAKYPTGLCANFSIQTDLSQALRDIQRSNVTIAVAFDAVWYTETIAESP